MRLRSLWMLVVLVAAGCAAPAGPPEPEITAIDLGSRLGLMIVDLETGAITPLTEKPGLAWMSPSGAIVSWTDVNFAVVLDRATGTREVGAMTPWARIHDNGTGLLLEEGQGRIRGLVSGETIATITLPPAPLVGSGWTAASADFDVLGGEYVREGARPGGCANDIFLLAEGEGARTSGCHLRVALDGRAAWTEATGVRLRERDGAPRNITGTGHLNETLGGFVAHENPVFKDDGLLFLRLVGDRQLNSTSVVDEAGNVYVTVAGPREMALHDVSADGRSLLLRTYVRT